MIGVILMNNDHEDIGRVLWWCSGPCGLFVYIFGSFVAVRVFVKNLKTLALLRVNSHRDVTASADAIALSDQQQKLLDLSAKYVLLFVFAILSTVLNYVLCIVVSVQMGGLFL